MNKQRKVVITTTYNEMGIIIDTKVEELGTSAQPEIIYCKDCVHNIEPEFGFCDRANHHVSLNSYCANVFHAERREVTE